MFQAPTAPIARNHAIQTGPKSMPTTLVPYFSIKKSAIRIPAEMGTTKGLNAEVPISRPSTADNTLIAGVRTASP